MTHPWRILESLFLAEARDAAYYRNQLVSLVQRRFGQHEADELTSHMQKLTPEEFSEYVELYFVDPEVDDITKRMIDATRATPSQGQGDPGRPSLPTQSRSNDKGSKGAEAIPQRPRADGPVSSPLHGAPRTSVRPGEKPQHAVGSAGQNQPRQQFSVAAGLVPQKHDPKKDPKSGVVAAQREVDRMYRDGDKKGAIKLAQQLGVPTPEERFHYDSNGQMSRDAGGKPRIVVWAPDRVFKWRSDDSRDLDVDADNPRAVSMKGAEPLPKHDRPDRLDLIRRGLAKRDVGAVPTLDKLGPERPPSFDGEVWQPHGRSGEERTMRPDAVTGNFVYGKRQTDPSKTGGKLVGYKGKWLTPSQYASTRASDAGVQLRKSDTPWRAWQHPPRRGKHAGPTPNSPPQRVVRPEPPEPEDEFSDIATDPGIDVGDEE